MCLLSLSDMRKKIGSDRIFYTIKTVDLENVRVAFIIRKFLRIYWWSVSFLFAQDFCWLINGPFRFHVGTVNDKPMLFTPRAFWSFDGYDQLSLTRILCLYYINCVSYFQTPFVAFNCRGIFQFRHCYCTKNIFFRDIQNLWETMKQKSNNEIFEEKN